MGNRIKGPIEGDKAVLVLDRQPSLTKAVFVRIINQEEEEFNMERANVLVMQYADDQMSLPSNIILIFGEREIQ